MVSSKRLQLLYLTLICGAFTGKDAAPHPVEDGTSKQAVSAAVHHSVKMSKDEWRELVAQRRQVAPCEEVVTGMNGRLQSPNYPDDFPDNVACAWDIEVPEGYQVSLRFTDFHLQPSQGCIADYVGVYDGENYFLLCGWQPPPAITSKENQMGIVLVSDEHVHFGSRFAAEFVANSVSGDANCTGFEDIWIATAYDYGFASSPGYPADYPNGIFDSCGWYIHANSTDEDENVLIGFLQIRTAGAGDYVRVDPHDGPAESYSGDFDFTGSFPKLVADRSGVDIDFHTDGSGTDIGYLLAWAAPMQQRDWTYTTGYYETSTEYPWWFETTSWGYRSEQLLQGEGEAVRSRNVDAKLVHGEKSRKKGHQKQVGPSPSKKSRKSGIARVISPAMKPDHTVHIDASSGEAWIVSAVTAGSRQSKESKPQGGMFAGDATPKAALRAKQMAEPVPGRKFGFVKSPNHPDPYPGSSNVLYNVTSTPGSRIALRFLRFDLEPGYDFLKIMGSNGSVIETITTLKENIIYSSDSEMFLQFTSDGSYQATGFLAAYASIDP